MEKINYTSKNMTRKQYGLLVRALDDEKTRDKLQIVKLPIDSEFQKVAVYHISTDNGEITLALEDRGIFLENMAFIYYAGTAKALDSADKIINNLTHSTKILEGLVKA